MVWCVFISMVPVGSWICPSEACFTALPVSFTDFADPSADSLTAVFDGVDAAADVDEETLMELAMPNWSDHWKSPVSAMILRP